MPTSLPELNFTHLRSFRAAVRAAGIGAAARSLGLSQPTVSEQMAALARAVGQPLVERRGDRLEPTAIGRVVLAHAEEIFAAAERLARAVAAGVDAGSAPQRVVVGIVETMPKRVAWRLLEPALTLPQGTAFDCREGSQSRLLAELAVHALDLVLSDTPLGAGQAIAAYNHLLGESAVAWFAQPGLAPGAWPRCLDGAPVLLPAAGTPLRHRLDEWLHGHDLRPRLVGEFQDSALLKAAGSSGAGAFPAPAVLAESLQAETGVVRLGACTGLAERFYAISPERRVSDPAVAAICRGARGLLTRPARSAAA